MLFLVQFWAPPDKSGAAAKAWIFVPRPLAVAAWHHQAGEEHYTKPGRDHRGGGGGKSAPRPAGKSSVAVQAHPNPSTDGNS